MIISIIVAVDENRGIGFENKIPWHLPADLARFKKLTMGHHLVVGRKTYESIGRAATQIDSKRWRGTIGTQKGSPRRASTSRPWRAFWPAWRSTS